MSMTAAVTNMVKVESKAGARACQRKILLRSHQRRHDRVAY